MAFVPRPCTADPETLGESARADFALMVADEGDIRRYWRLAAETAHHVFGLERRLERSLGSRWFSVGDAHWAVDHLERFSHVEDSADLARRWRDWGDRYRTIVEQSPKWRLKDMISRVSETHACRSWPKRWERDVWEWAMADDGIACPFVDRRGWIGADFRQRLRQTIEEAGGFLHHCDERGYIVFAPAADLEAVWRRQDELAAIDRAKPFGFFHDASRPGFKMRALTPLEKSCAAIQVRKKRRPE